MIDTIIRRKARTQRFRRGAGSRRGKVRGTYTKLQTLHKSRKPAMDLSLAADRRGTAIIELALTLPILAVFLFGIVSGGSWLAMSHVVQESANEGARAALAGITAPERAALASSAARTTLARSYGISESDIALRVDDDGRKLTVNVSYDGSGNALLKLPIMPAATTTIRRQASVVLQGF
jgi:Flp pilus assembly protein TadG